MIYEIHNAYGQGDVSEYRYLVFGVWMELYTLGCSNTHNNTLQVLQRTAFGPA
jgi:hypothetical protein